MSKLIVSIVLGREGREREKKRKKGKGEKEEKTDGGTGGGGEYEENSGRTKKTHSETWLLVTSR